MKKMKNVTLIGIVICLAVFLIFMLIKSYKTNTNVQSKKNDTQKVDVKNNDNTTNVKNGNVLSEKDATKLIIDMISEKNKDLLSQSTLEKEFKYGQKIDTGNLKTSMKDYKLLGFFDQLKALNNAVYYGDGWAYSDDKNIDYILLLNSNGEIRGVGVWGLQRNGLSKAINKKDADKSGWIGFVIKQENDSEINAYVKIKDTNSYVKLNKSFK